MTFLLFLFFYQERKGMVIANLGGEQVNRAWCGEAAVGGGLSL
jgi:hypothetical protein